MIMNVVNSGIDTTLILKEHIFLYRVWVASNGSPTFLNSESEKSIVYVLLLHHHEYLLIVVGTNLYSQYVICC